jgi:tetratricopeptide (TPR) repeat protein
VFIHLFISCLILCATPASDELEKHSQAEINSFLGVELLKQGDPASALAKFTLALELNPELWEARYNRGLANLQLGKPTEAFTDLSTCLQSRPDEPNTLRLLALIAWADDRTPTAIELLEKAVTVANPPPLAWRDLGQLYLWTGNWEKGSDALRKYLELDPDAADAPLALDLAQMANKPTEHDAIRERLVIPLPENEQPYK